MFTPFCYLCIATLYLPYEGLTQIIVNSYKSKLQEILLYLLYEALLRLVSPLDVYSIYDCRTDKNLFQLLN